METSDLELKHLGFVRVIASIAVVWLSCLYDYAKQNSGPLKSTVGTVENAVTTVVGPVYERLKGLPDDLLARLDTKVDNVSKKFDEHAPPVAKKIVNRAKNVVQKGSQVAQDLVQQAQVGGPRAALRHAASLSKNIAVRLLAVLWHRLINRYPPLHGVGGIAIPTVADVSNKYNKFIAKLDGRGYHIFSYFPSVPVEDVAEAYKQVEAAAAKKDVGVTSSETD
ncbi:REF/SRPP-like protein At1g67360 [Coffea eugenioides]|uniref:REF/SRPP-like protein At1g67360 n=1 Tax=Coffea eugenioides TaxID=49369 RepID=UPI000F61123C|nr:REF/SRPP-like protein At1g67360 [Coffea eugenioides]